MAFVAFVVKMVFPLKTGEPIIFIGLTQNERKTTKYGVWEDRKTAYMGSFA